MGDDETERLARENANLRGAIVRLLGGLTAGEQYARDIGVTLEGRPQAGDRDLMRTHVRDMADRMRDLASDARARIEWQVDRDWKGDYLRALGERDHWRRQAEVTYSLRDEFAEMLGVQGLAGDEQFAAGLERLRLLVSANVMSIGVAAGPAS